MNLKNKVIIVTGGSGLIGESIINNIRDCGGIAINGDLNPGDTNKKFYYKESDLV